MLYNKKINIVPFKYIPTKYIYSYKLNTYLNIHNDITNIPKEIYDYRPNFGNSQLIWSPSWENINLEHPLIQIINHIGFKYYKRKTNLITVIPNNNIDKITINNNIINNPLTVCIYQETNGNPLNINKKVYFNWFFDSFRNKIDYDNDSLFIYQFYFYNLKENVLRQRYGLPIDINNTNIYPNCLKYCFNIKQLLNIYNSTNINLYDRKKTCFVRRKTNNTHPLKFIDTIEDYYKHPADCIDIENNTLQENINIFLKSEKFYCYDNISFLPVIAAICGCIPILNQNYTGFKDIREIYKKYAPWMYYGMAYDDTEKEINFARKTQNKLINILEKINNTSYNGIFSESSSEDHIYIFLKYLETYFNVSFVEN